MPSRKICAIAALFVLGTLSQAANGALVLDVGPGGVALACGGGCGLGTTHGWAFDVLKTVTVDGIGVWNALADGIGATVEAGLWIDGGVLLASVTISDASPTEPSSGDGVWLVEDILPVTLTPGRYVVGSVVFDPTPRAQFKTAYSTISEIAWVVGRQGPEDGGLAQPVSDFTPSSGAGIFGPTLRLASSQVPEPNAAALAGLGLIVIGAFRRWPHLDQND